MSTRVFPGQDLAPASKYVSGSGTIVCRDRIHSTLVGVQNIAESPSGMPILSVVRQAAADQASQPVRNNLNLLPEVGSIVLARVTRINRLQAQAQIIVVGETPLVEDFQGIIRIADVRATEKDKVKIQTSFRPGDIVRAEVISLGDQMSYFLSTARNDLGVLFAWNEAGKMMYPSSWREMRSASGIIEERKVAKPFV